MSDAFLKPVIACNEDGHGASVEGVALDIWNERLRQDAKWGVQNHPDGTGPDHRYGWGTSGGHADWTLKLVADECKIMNDAAAKHGGLTWFDILQEEFFEAAAESDPAKLRAELIQVAAVAVAWIEAIDRRMSDRAEGVARARTEAFAKRSRSW